MIRRFENMEYYNDYTEKTLPRVRGSQYNPMIKDERKSLMEDILNQLDSDINGYINGQELLVDEDSGIGVWSSFDLRESGDDLDHVKLFCDIDDGNGSVRDLAEHDVFIDWDSFMDSYDIESDVVSYVEDEAKKWFKTCVRSFNQNMRESKIRRKRIERVSESLDDSVDLAFIESSISDIETAVREIKRIASRLRETIKKEDADKEYVLYETSLLRDYCSDIDRDINDINRHA